MKIYAGLFAIVLFALTGCAANSGEKPNATTPTPQSTAAPEFTTSEPVLEESTSPPPSLAVAKIGELAVNGGIELTVQSAKSSPTVALNTSNYRAGSGFETYEDVAAQSGGRYIVVTAKVTNNSKAPIDLTCGYPIKIEVINEGEQIYTPIDKLYQIKGNPECNASLQPGFNSTMTWAFMVPNEGKVMGALFTEVDMANYNADPTLIAFSAGGI